MNQSFKNRNKSTLVLIQRLGVDGPVPLLLLLLLSVLLSYGPRLNLPGAKYGVDESAPDVDHGRHPEHLPPAGQCVLKKHQ